MNLEELKANLANALIGVGNRQGYDYLADFCKRGGEQFHAYEVLKELRATKTYDEDLLLELMDIVSGWCGETHRIWAHKLGNRVCLYTVDACEIRDGWRSLLPGVRQARILEYDLGWVKQGAELELLYPDGTTNTTTMENYYIDVPAAPTDDFEIREAPIVICVPESFFVPVGTEIWCVRPD